MDKIKELLKKYNQEHLLVTYDTLTEGSKRKLLESIESIDFEMATNLLKNSSNVNQKKDIDKISSKSKAELSKEEIEKYEDIGRDIISSGKYAVITMAGGQGTRLGHSGPKGTFLLHLKDKDKYIFEIFIEKLKKAKEDYGVYIHWYVMTSEANNQDTINFFENNNYFGYPKEYVKFFKQGELPITTTSGDLVLETRDTVFKASDGNGGVFKALNTNKIIDELKALNISWVLITGIDNILAKLLDPLFIGMSVESGYLNGVKSVERVLPEERVGVFCMENGHPGIIEYSEMTDAVRYAKDGSNALLYKDANIVNHLLSIEILDKIKKEQLPIHKAFKKLNYIDKDGNYIVAQKPNLYKYEMFIFDYFKLVDNTLIYRVKREEEFAPVKNKEGEDSPETAIKLYNAIN